VATKVSEINPTDQRLKTEKASQPTRAATPAVPDQQQNLGSPFQHAKKVRRGVKLFLHGESGTGKTTLSLQFPDTLSFDLEGGTDLYGDAFDFDVLRTTDPDQVMRALDWLRSHEHSYRTLVVDPVTVYWEALQYKWSNILLKRNRSSKGFKYEFYEFQPKDWMVIKAEFKEFIRKLISLDMNVVVTAREKVQYADGAFMRPIGQTFDGEKSLPYLFDVIIRLYRDETGRFLGRCLKDRSNRLPQKEFEVSYSLLEERFQLAPSANRQQSKTAY
jgi:hypothetical protein